MRFVKIIGAIVGVVVLIVVGLGIYISTIDFNSYKDTIAAEVKKATGRDLVIKGKLDVSLGLSPTVNVNDVTFQNVSWGSRPEMIKVKRLELTAELLPLISGMVKVTKLTLVGADIVMETDKSGKGNWEMGGGATPAPAPAPAGAPKPAQPAGKAALPQVDRVIITDSTIVYKDGQANKTTTVVVKKLDASGIGSSGGSTLELDAVMNNAPLTVKADMSALAGFIDSNSGTFDVKIKGANNNLAAKGKLTNGQPEMTINADGDSLAGLKPLIGAALPPLGPYALAGKLTSPAKDTMRLDITSLKVGSSQMTGDVAIGKDGAKPKLTVNLNAARLNVLDFNKSAGGGGGGAGGGAAKGGGDGKVFPADPLPVDDLRSANVTLNLKAQEIVNDNIKAQNLVVAMTLVNGRLNAKPTASLSGGTVAIDLTLDASQQGAPRLAFVLKGQRVNIGDLMKMLQNSDAITGGPADVDIAVNGVGNSIRAIMASLNGQTSVSVNGGTLNNKALAFVNADVMKLLGGSGNTTQIKCIVSRFSIVNGIATSQQLGFDLSNIYGSGKGNINLQTEGLNMEINPKTRNSALASLAVPIDVKGTLANPSVTPDLAKGAGDLAKGIIGKPKDAVGGLTGGLPSGLPGGILGKDSKAPAPQQQAAGGGGGCGGGDASDAPAAAPAPSTGQPAQQPKAPAQQKPQDKLKGIFR